MLERAGIAAGLAFQAHPHMLRHACGFTLVNKGTDTQTYLGHKNIQHTVRYTGAYGHAVQEFVAMSSKATGLGSFGSALRRGTVIAPSVRTEPDCARAGTR